MVSKPTVRIRGINDPVFNGLVVLTQTTQFISDMEREGWTLLETEEFSSSHQKESQNRYSSWRQQGYSNFKYFQQVAFRNKTQTTICLYFGKKFGKKK